jgi:hypothetical protein
MDGHGVVGLNRTEPSEINWYAARLRHRGYHRYWGNNRRGRAFEKLRQERPRTDGGRAD